MGGARQRGAQLVAPHGQLLSRGPQEEGGAIRAGKRRAHVRVRSAAARTCQHNSTSLGQVACCHLHGTVAWCLFLFPSLLSVSVSCPDLSSLSPLPLPLGLPPALRPRCMPLCSRAMSGRAWRAKSPMTRRHEGAQLFNSKSRGLSCVDDPHGHPGGPVGR